MSRRRGESRRAFLKRSAWALGGLALGGGALDACARGAKRGAGKGPLRISNWPIYIDSETVPQFEAATGIEVEYNEDLNDSDEFFAKIAEPLARGQSIDRDVVVLPDWLVGRMIRLGYCSKLDHSKFRNRDNLLESLRNPSFDPGRVYSVPWMLGMVGIAYNPKRTGRELRSVEDLLDPEFKGRVTMVTEMRDTLGLMLLAMGRDTASFTMADARAACDRVRAARESGQVRAFTGNDYVADLAAGNIAAAIGWSGDIQGVAADNPDLRWIAPDEGAILYSDNMFLPITAERRDEAYAWFDWVYEPAHSAQIAAAVPYISPVRGAVEELAKIAPDLAQSELIDPWRKLGSRLHEFRDLSDDEERELERMFQEAIGA